MIYPEQMAQLVFWPQNSKAVLTLVDEHGEAVAKWPLRDPMRGDQLARLVPIYYGVAVENVRVSVLTSSGVAGRTVGEFDTAVVTTRPVVTLEQRLQRLERLEARKVAAIERLERDRQKKADDEPLIEPDDGPAKKQPHGEPQDPPAQPKGVADE